MPNEPRRIYWDSCVYISCIEGTPSRIDVLRKILNAAVAGEIVLVASTLVIAEVTKFNDDSKTASEQAELIRAFFENDYMRFYGVDRKTAEDATEISRATKLKPPDAIHLATAIRLKCECFQTYDGEKGGPEKMLAFNGKIGKPPLRIELPAMLEKDRELSLF